MSGFYIENFGCRAARADGEAVAERLRAEGLAETGADAAEVVVVNTCSVTAEADRAARAFIRRTNRKNPEAKIVVTGCYAQRAPDELAALAGVRAVVGNSHKAFAPAVVEELLQSPVPKSEGHDGKGKGAPENFGLSDDHSIPPFAKNAKDGAPDEFVSVHKLLQGSAVAILADDRFAHSFLEEAQIAPSGVSDESEDGGRNQTRPNLKIQEGCENHCTFCVIPQTRGASRSLDAAAVMRQVEGFVAAGGNELVMSGINLGRWGRERGMTDEPRTLTALVAKILNETKLPRLRLSSIEPMDWTDELIALMAEHAPRVARHAHLPLQSGSDAVLRRMHRRYRPWHYAAKVEKLVRAVGDGLTIGADVMAGFPGETDAEFEETVALIRALPFGYLHLFPFSARPGTPGWAMHAANPVPTQVVDERMARLRSLAAEKMRAHREKFVGREVECITLHTDEKLAAQSKTNALSENFLPVVVEGRQSANRMLRARVLGLDAEGRLMGEADRPDTASIIDI